MKLRITLLFCTLAIIVSCAVPRAYRFVPGERGESYAYAASLSYEVHSIFGMGSGWALDEDTLVTNWHVVEAWQHMPNMPRWVEKGDTAWAVLSFERLPGMDGALVHVAGDPLTVGVVGIDPILGDWLLMVGSPHDSVTPIVTWGLMAGQYDDTIAVDGAIIPGMSGGPVINQDGLVVGMNVATTLPPGRSLGLIIPMSEIMEALRELERDAQAEAKRQQSQAEG